MSESMKDKLQAILDEATQNIQDSDALDKLNDVRVSFLGKRKVNFCFEGNERCRSGRPSESRADGQ